LHFFLCKWKSLLYTSGINGVRGEKMKKLITFILTLGMIFLLGILGVSLSAKGLLMDTADGLVKNEIKNNLVKVVEESTKESISHEVVEKIEKELNNNTSIKKLMEKYYDELLEVLTTEKNELSIDIQKEVETLINENEVILKEYGITLSESDKNQILDLVSSDELNKTVNENIKEMKNSISGEAKIVLDGYRFLTGDTFKGIIISIVVVCIIIICLLKKNYYGWLFNFSLASFIVGVIYSVLSFVIGMIITSVAQENGIQLSMSSLSHYGYILIALSIISFIIYKVFGKREEKLEVNSETKVVEG